MRENLLLINDEPVDWTSMQELLKEPGTGRPFFNLECVDSLSDGIKKICKNRVDLILFDLTMPDKSSVDSFNQIKKEAEDIPIIILANPMNENLAQSLLQSGARDYIIKGKTSSDSLIRSIKYAIENNKLSKEVKSKSKLSEVSFRKIIETNADSIIIFNKEGIVLYVNPAAVNFFGINENDLLNKNFGGPVLLGDKTEVEITRGNGDIVVGEMLIVDIEWDGEMVNLATIRDITERKNAERKVKEEKKYLYSLVNSINTGLFVVDPVDHTIIDINNFALNLIGAKTEEILGKKCFKFLCPRLEGECPVDAKAQVMNSSERILLDIHGAEIPILKSVVPIERYGRKYLLESFTDISVLKELEKFKKLSTEILEVLNASKGKREIIQKILESIKDNSGLEAVGIRLQDGPDCPYFAAIGFKDKHVKGENFHYSYDDNRTLMKEAEGRPGPECMCERIISGRTEVTFPFITGYGSFWTNSVTELLVSLSTGDFPGRFRGCCGAEGYESAALIPLKSGSSIIGLLQLNDTRKGVFNENIIRFFEGIGASIGIALENQKSEEKNSYYAHLFQNVSDALISTDMEFVVQSWNKAAEEIYGWREEEILGKKIPEILKTKFVDVKREQILDAFKQNGYFKGEVKQIHKNGKVLHILASVTMLKDQDEKPIGTIASNKDITERRMMERQILDSLQEKDILLQEIHHRVKNNMQVISSLLGLQINRLKKKKEIEVLKKCKNRIRAMALVHEKLYMSESLLIIDFKKYIETLILELFNSYNIWSNKIKTILEIEDIDLDIQTSIPCALIINELVSNSLLHAFPVGLGGYIKIILKREIYNQYLLIIEDNGRGMPKKFDLQKTKTLGLRLIHSLAHQFHGSVEIKNGRGMRVFIRFTGIDPGIKKTNEFYISKDEEKNTHH